MRYVVFDIETQNIFQEVGSNNPADLDISILCAYDSETNEYSSYLEDELQNFWPIIEKADAIVGYNSNYFDIPLLNKYYPGDLRQLKSIDLLEAIRKSSGRRFKLGNVAEATVGYGKSGDGLEALKWWRNGEVEKVRKYCLQDVKVTKEIFEYAMHHKMLKYKDIGEVQEIPIDTSDWDKVKEGSMTQSLPF